MFTWIAENAVTVVAAAVVAALIGVALFSVVRSKKKKGGCTGDCVSCGACAGECRRESGEESVL